MGTLARRLVGRRWLQFAVLVLVVADPGGRVGAQTPSGQKQVLVLYSTRRDSQIAIVGERELPRILADGLTENLDYYSEYIDQARFPDPSYKAAFRDFLRTKYRDQRFDVVIAMDEIALGFFAETRTDLFQETPVVSFSISPETAHLPNSTGLIAHLDFSGTIALASALQPDLRNVFVVAGSDDLPTLDVARAQFRAFESRLTFTYLTGLDAKEVDRRLASLPRHSIVYYVVVSRDAAGENFNPLEFLDRVVAKSNAPVYCWVDSAMDHKIVGGSLKSQQAEIDALGILALRVLHGERADDIPWSSPDLNVRQVNWRQMKLWGIDEARVPPGTIIKFRDPSVWDRYALYIGTAAILLFAQTVLIAALLVQRARRRRAEQHLLGSQTRLRKSYDRIRALGSRLLKAQETERARIARDLHDDIGQQVALLAIDLEMLKSQGHDVPGEALNRAQDLARSVHDLSHRLHPAKLRLIGLVAALEGLQREPISGGIPTTFTHEHVPKSLPADVTLCLFRISQEALQNANKYSAADHVSLHLAGNGTALSLTIADNGVGFDVDEAMGRGLGLVSIGERLDAVGGTLNIVSRPGAGTRLEVTVPLRADSA
jgi:signal transduction histidine kinase